MRLTTRGRYAVTAMLDLALSGRNGPVTVAHISARQKISPAYLEQLFARLRNHRLVESVRGPGGGFCLSRLPDDISVAEIIRAVDEPIDAAERKPVYCVGKLRKLDLPRRVKEWSIRGRARPGTGTRARRTSMSCDIRGA